MGGVDIPYPKLIDFVLPGNRTCGVRPDSIRQRIQDYSDQISSSQD